MIGQAGGTQTAYAASDRSGCGHGVAFGGVFFRFGQVEALLVRVVLEEVRVAAPIDEGLELLFGFVV